MDLFEEERPNAIQGIKLKSIISINVGGLKGRTDPKG